MAERQRGKRKTFIGEVVSDKMDKTVVVQVTRLVRHPLYEKVIKKRKKFHAHDEHNECRVGDIVEIMETRPLSKTKRWRVVRIIRRAGERAAPEEAPLPEEEISEASLQPEAPSGEQEEGLVQGREESGEVGQQ